MSPSNPNLAADRTQRQAQRDRYPQPHHDVHPGWKVAPRQQHEYLRSEISGRGNETPSLRFGMVVVDQGTDHLRCADRVWDRSDQGDHSEPEGADVILRHRLTDDERQYPAITNDTNDPRAFKALSVSPPKLFEPPAAVATVIHSPKVCLQ